MKNPSMVVTVDPFSGIDHLSQQLPFEIHLLIILKFHFVDFTRFSAVCKAWRSIASAARKSPFFCLQKQVPWPIYARELPNIFCLNDWFSICGSSQDWLLLSQSSRTSNSDNGEKLSLLNPTTKQRISLPENPMFILQVGVILPQSRNGIKLVAYFRNSCFGDDSFYQWGSQNKHWTKTHWDIGSSGISDMIYHKGNIYAVHNNCHDRIFRINISSYWPCRWLKTASPFVNCRLKPKFQQLVECDGNLLMVLRSCLCGRWEATVDVRVFKYITRIEDGGCCCEKVESIGEKYALLLGKGNSMAIDVSNNTRFRANCVYFLERRVGIRGFNLRNKRFMHI